MGQRGLSPILIILLIAAVTFGYLVYSGKINLPQKQTQTSKSDASPVPNGTGETSNWKTYTNNSFTFKYPSDWAINGHEIKSSSPTLRIYMTEETSLMNECMEEISVNKQDNFFTRKFQRVVTGAMCGGGDPTARELWVIPKEASYGPGIIIYYSSKDEEIIEPTINQILSTFKFTN